MGKKRRTRKEKIRASQRPRIEPEATKEVTKSEPRVETETEKKRLIIKDLRKTIGIGSLILVILAAVYWYLNH
jgi:hypothetical protein